MKPVRVVLDTNCLVSALLFGKGRLAALRRAWQGGGVRPLMCAQTVAELVRVLAYPKFDLSREEIETLLAEVVPFAETCCLEAVVAPVEGLKDPDDAVFVQLARQSGAEALVSGDAHLLQLSLPDVKILTPADFLKQIQA